MTPQNKNEIIYQKLSSLEQTNYKKVIIMPLLKKQSLEQQSLNYKTTLSCLRL